MPAGRPKSVIDWKEVENLLLSGSPVREIAGYIGVDERTIYDRCEKDHGIKFSVYSQEFKAKGASILRAHQYAKALGKTNDGDNTLLIWLGKQRLDQRDKPKEQDEEDDIVRRVVQAIKIIDDLPGAGKAKESEVASKSPVLD